MIREIRAAVGEILAKPAYLFLAVFHVLFLLSLPLGRPSYEDALFAYFITSPFIYSLYLDLYATNASKKELYAIFAVYLTLFILLWFIVLVATRDWWRALETLFTMNLYGLSRYLYYFSTPSPSPSFDRVRVVKTLYPLLPLHAAYAVVALSIVLSAGLDRYRLFMWYLAIYPAALAAAVAGGGRPASLAAAAIYLAAYATDTELLLLLLPAVLAILRFYKR